jgi:hypothetical protein
MHAQQAEYLRACKQNVSALHIYRMQARQDDARSIGRRAQPIELARALVKNSSANLIRCNIMFLSISLHFFIRVARALN